MGAPHLANRVAQQIVSPPFKQVHREEERPAGTKGASVIRHNIHP